MNNEPLDLDKHRGMAAQKSTELRRRLHEVQADQTALRQRQDEFESWASPLGVEGRDRSITQRVQ